jgi:hypothetical protein
VSPLGLDAPNDQAAAAVTTIPAAATGTRTGRTRRFRSSLGLELAGRGRARLKTRDTRRARASRSFVVGGGVSVCVIFLPTPQSEGSRATSPMTREDLLRPPPPHCQGFAPGKLSW